MLSIRARLDRARRTGVDAGVTLTELLVSMGLMLIVATLALGWLIGENTSDTKTTNSTFALSDARNLLQAWPALLRVADSPSGGYTSVQSSGSTAAATTVAPGQSTGRFLAISTTSITFNADVGNRASCTTNCARGATTQVTLALSNGALTQTLVTNGTTKTMTYVRSGAALLPASGSCLFTAYSPSGTMLGCASSLPLGTIASITLAFTVTPDQSGTTQTYSTSTAITGSFAPAVATATATSAGS